MSLFSLPIIHVARETRPNLWDALAFALVVGIIIAVVHSAHGAVAPISTVENGGNITLDPSALPGYALRTVLRMIAAMFASLLFTLSYAPLAAKSKRAGQILIPLLDILQSLPVFSFLTFFIAFFLNLFPTSVLGPELASIFLVFTAQAWNMAFSFYQSLTTVPRDLDEAARNFQLSAWQRFWRLEVPLGMPGLVWNAMMSMSGSWFFVVASEAVSVGSKNFTLPGVGAYVAQALSEGNLPAIFYAIATMALVILAYDQLLFRPLVAWAEKFKFENIGSDAGEDPWALKLIQRTRLMQVLLRPVEGFFGSIARLRFETKFIKPIRVQRSAHIAFDIIWYATLCFGFLLAAWKIVAFITLNLQWRDVMQALEFGAFTFLRVMVLISLASLIWVPIGVWVGLHASWARRMQSLVQFLAAFPANLLFPVAVVLIVRTDSNPDIWLSPLMILGTQWYILFNVIAGASVFPGDLREASTNFQIKGWRWWRKIMLPGIFPYYVTGAITASGGSWNASIVAEIVSWKHTSLEAHGLGAYIGEAMTKGDMPRMVLGTVVMSLFVIFTNRLLWRPLYEYAARRLRFD
jgi:NitT/TauT family transport system permease protein